MKQGIRSTIYECRSKDYAVGGSMVVVANGQYVRSKVTREKYESDRLGGH
jgi:hypothetical protein